MSKENKIPTAEEFLENSKSTFYSEDLIKFAKLHVKAALEAAANDISEGSLEAMRECIITAYPLEDIK